MHEWFHLHPKDVLQINFRIMEAKALKTKSVKKKKWQMSGAQAVVHSLLAEGVDLIFGYPGGAIMPVYDALYDHEENLKQKLRV